MDGVLKDGRILELSMLDHIQFVFVTHEMALYELFKEKTRVRIVIFYSNLFLKVPILSATQLIKIHVTEHLRSYTLNTC